MPEVAFPRLVAHVQLADGRVIEARILNTDLIRWDRTRAKHGWPAASDAPAFAATFYAWSAMRREGEIAETVTWEEFSDRLAEHVAVTSEGENGVDPTPANPGPE